MNYCFKIMIPLFFAGIIITTSCSDSKTTEEKTEIKTMDSTSKEVKENINKLEDQTKKVEESLEKLDKEFENDK